MPMTDHPENPPLDPAEVSSTDSSDAEPAAAETEHLDAIEIPVIDEEQPPPPGGEFRETTANGLITRDVFHAMFCQGHKIAGLAFGLQTLVASAEMPEARGASDAIYDICLESPWLRFLLDPKAVWLQRAAAIAAFAVPVAAGVAEELRARDAKPAGSGSTAEPEAEASPA
ncbi:MAG: hypothetical protein MI806_34275 [Minwuiales bacterium]|nr:hypothetical protein [Minwuiales bacterium]